MQEFAGLKDTLSKQGDAASKRSEDVMGFLKTMEEKLLCAVASSHEALLEKLKVEAAKPQASPLPAPTEYLAQSPEPDRQKEDASTKKKKRKQKESRLDWLSSFDMLLDDSQSPEETEASPKMLARSQVAAKQPKWTLESEEDHEDMTELFDSFDSDGEETMLNSSPSQDDDETQPAVGRVSRRRRSSRIRKKQSDEDSQQQMHAAAWQKHVLKSGAKAKRLKVSSARALTEYSEEF